MEKREPSCAVGELFFSRLKTGGSSQAAGHLNAQSLKPVLPGPWGLEASALVFQ